MARQTPQGPDSPRFPPTRKSLGQHFLTDRRILGRIADAVDARAGDVVIEIGPGRGALTDILAERAGRLVAIEYDRALAAVLRARYADRPHVEIVEADVLDTDLGALAGGPYRLVGNVPYYITTPILFHALRAPRPEAAVYLVQKEVADRIIAPPGHDDYGALSVNVQSVADATKVFGVPAGAFVPPPKVDSAVVKITPKASPVVNPEEEEGFRRFVMAVFGMRRKQMQKALRSVRGVTPDDAAAALRDAGIDPLARAETLSPAQLVGLYRRTSDRGQTPGSDPGV